MVHWKLLRLAGLVTMVGSVVFALGLSLRFWLNPMRAEALTVPMFFLLVVAAGVAIVATAVLLRGTPRSRLAILAGALSLVGMVLVFTGLLMGFVGLLVIPVGVLVATGGLWILANLAIRTGTLPWWGGLALVAGFVPFLLLSLFPFPPQAQPLIGVPWLVVGYALFRAAGQSTELPSRVR